MNTKQTPDPFFGPLFSAVLFVVSFTVFGFWSAATSQAQDSYPPEILERPSVSTNPNATTVSIRFVAYADSILARLAWFEAKVAELQASGGDSAVDTSKLDEIYEYVKQARLLRTFAVNYTWQHPGTNLASFHVERSFNGGPFEEIAVLPATARSYTDPKRPFGRHSYRVRAKAPDGTFSGYTSFKTLEVRDGAQSNSGIIKASEDTYVHGGEPSEPHGGELTMQAKSQGGTAYHRVMFLKFTLDDSSAVPTSVSLRLFSDPTTSAGTLLVHKVADLGWKEESLTYGNQPSMDSAPLASVTVQAGAEIAVVADGLLDVFKQALASGNQLSLAIVGQAEGGGVLRIKSRESGDDSAPSLLVKYN